MPRKMREMVGGCCVCSDERGWDENPLVYCDGQGCNVAVHQACYGIVSVPSGPWYCRKCESQERSARVRCELCPNKDGALKRTDTNSWAHVVCALYIPEVRFGNVSTMEPIVLGLIPQERYLKPSSTASRVLQDPIGLNVCYLCEQQGRESKATTGACMQCNRQGCKQSFHVTCAQAQGLLCEEAGNYMDNVKYCGYCDYHYQRINKKIVKTIPPYRPVRAHSGDSSPEKSPPQRTTSAEIKAPPNSAASTSSTSSTNSLGSLKKGKKGRKSVLSDPKLDAGSKLGSAEQSSETSSNEDEKSAPKSSSSEKAMSSSIDSPDEKKEEPPAATAASKPSLGVSTTVTKPSLPPSRNNSLGASKMLSEDVPQKNPSVIVKFGKHEGTYFKKDSKKNSVNVNSTNKNGSSKHKTGKREGEDDEMKTKEEKKADMEPLSFGKPPSSSQPPSIVDSSSVKKGFTTANFTETVVTPSSSVSKALFGGEEEEAKTDVDSTVKVEETETNSKDSSKPPTPEKGASTAAASVTVVPNDKPDKPETPKSSFFQSPKESTTPADLSKCSNVQVTLKPLEAIGPSGDAVKTEPEKPKKDPVTPVVKEDPDGVTAKPNSVTIQQISASASKDISQTDKAVRRSASGKRIGRPPKKGTHLPGTNSLGGIAGRSVSPPQSSPDEHDNFNQQRKRRISPGKRNNMSNGDLSNSVWMMGASLNPGSAMAKEMNSVLQNEIEAHSAYDPAGNKNLVGVPFPGKRRRTSGVASTSSGDPFSSKNQPQTLDELLERQWEQGSQFLMEQASHFDIASLLSSLHQLKEENVDLEDAVDKLVQRRDHLLAVRARLLALSSLSVQQPSPVVTPERATANGPASRAGSNSVSPRLNSAATISPSSSSTRNMLPSPRERTSAATVSMLPSPRSQPDGRLTSPRDHRAPPLPPMENGLDFHRSSAAQPTSSSAQLLTVVSQSGRLPPPGASLPPPGRHPPAGYSSRMHQQMMRGPPPPSTHDLRPPLPPPGAHDMSRPPPHDMARFTHGYQHLQAGLPPSSSGMVTLDRSSQHMRGGGMPHGMMPRPQDMPRPHDKR